MKFAYVNNIKREAEKGLIGYCRFCSSELIAKCGDYKVHHWSHKKRRNCDPWWEPETDWHRNWKNEYPPEWQELLFHDEKSGEKHISDVHTIHKLVIEFQHSPINTEERVSRETFYKNMIWVIDGTRSKRDCVRLQKGVKYFKETKIMGIFLLDYIDEVFPIKWLNSSVPVLFDFKGLDDLIDNADWRHKLFCVLPVKHGRYSVLAEISRDVFIRSTIDGEWNMKIQNIIDAYSPAKASKNDINQTKPKNEIGGTHYLDTKKGRFVKRVRF